MPATQISFTAFALAAFADNTRSIAVPGGVDTQQVVSVVLCAPLSLKLPLCWWLSQWRLTVGSAFALCGVLGLLLSLLIAGLLGLSAGTSVLTRSVACVILALLVSSFLLLRPSHLGWLA